MPSILGKITVRDKWICSVDSDPSAGAGVVAPVGSIAIINNGGTGTMYQKTGAGDTSWTLQGGSSPSSPVEVNLGAGTNIDWNAGSSFRKSISADTAFTFSNTGNAKSVKLTVTNSGASPVTISFSGVSVNSSFNNLIYPTESLFLEITQVNGVYFIQQEKYKPINPDLNTNGGYVIGDYADTYKCVTSTNKILFVSRFSEGRTSRAYVENTGGSPITISFNGLGVTPSSVTGTVSSIGAGQRYMFEFSCVSSPTFGGLVVYIRSISLN